MRLKAEEFGLLGSEMCVKIFLQSLEHEFAACILKAKKARSLGVSFIFIPLEASPGILTSTE